MVGPGARGFQSWYSGPSSAALASLLFGDENPSGKLPTTFPRRIEDAPAFGNYPGENDHVAYAEGLHIGHRHYDQRGIEPLFCFGHGLSYTTFSYGEVRTSAEAMEGDGELTVEVDVTNTGDRTGAEVVQLTSPTPRRSSTGPTLLAGSRSWSSHPARPRPPGSPSASATSPVGTRRPMPG